MAWGAPSSPGPHFLPQGIVLQNPEGLASHPEESQPLQDEGGGFVDGPPLKGREQGGAAGGNFHSRDTCKGGSAGSSFQPL